MRGLGIEVIAYLTIAQGALRLDCLAALAMTGGA